MIRSLASVLAGFGVQILVQQAVYYAVVGSFARRGYFSDAEFWALALGHVIGVGLGSYTTARLAPTAARAHAAAQLLLAMGVAFGSFYPGLHRVAIGLGAVVAWLLTTHFVGVRRNGRTESRAAAV